MEFSRPEYWSGYPFSSPGDLPNPGIEPRSSALQADSLPAEPQGKPRNTGAGCLSLLQRIFPTQELNQGLQHCRWILYQLSYQGSPHSRQREQHIKGPMAERNMEPLRPEAIFLHGKVLTTISISLLDTGLFRLYISSRVSGIVYVFQRTPRADLLQKVAQSCSTLCDLMDYIVHGILQARILEWVAFPFSMGSLQPGDQTQVSCISGGFFNS